ncbi:MAG TPA: flavodoxin [Bacteroidales bacterium]|nr:flavodoxin [Bacteroidales bacterium]
MKNIGVFYGAKANTTGRIANKIADALKTAAKTQKKSIKVSLIPIEDDWRPDFSDYDLSVLGVSTWFDGELPNYWDEALPALRTLDLSNKSVAIFGLGDQENYPENFVDGIGYLATIFESLGATVTGYTSTEGYTYLRSAAQRGDQFAGLAIDQDSQPEQTDGRIESWVATLL